MEKKDNGSGLTFGDFLMSFLVALVGGATTFAVIAFVGYQLSGRQAIIAQTPDTSQTVQNVQNVTPPAAQVSTPNFSEKQRAASQKPAASVAQSEREEVAEPVQKDSTPEPETSQSPESDQLQTKAQANTSATTPSSGKTQNNGTGITMNPANDPTQQEQTQASTAISTQSRKATISNGDGTYTHDFSGGRVLITTESNNGSDPVYHTWDCRAAKKIPPENEGWYDSAQAAKGAGRRLCGYCDK